METSTKLICLVGCVVLMASCLSANIVKQRKAIHESKKTNDQLKNTYCVDFNTKSKACHGGRCHDSSMYLHACDHFENAKNDEYCDNFTATLDTFNSTGWLNTTCYVYACEVDYSDECGNATLLYDSWTNGDFRNGSVKLHGCFSESFGFDSIGHQQNVGDIFDVPCLNLFLYADSHSISNKK